MTQARAVMHQQAIQALGTAAPCSLLPTQRSSACAREEAMLSA